MRKILLIEDNADHAQILLIKLSASFPDIGVMQFNTLSHARLTWQQTKEAFIAVIVDLGLPDSARQDTLDFINSVREQTPLIIYSCDKLDLRELVDKSVHCVQKPDRSNKLIAILNEIIAGGAE